MTALWPLGFRRRSSRSIRRGTEMLHLGAHTPTGVLDCFTRKPPRQEHTCNPRLPVATGMYVNTLSRLLFLHERTQLSSYANKRMYSVDPMAGSPVEGTAEIGLLFNLATIYRGARMWCRFESTKLQTPLNQIGKEFCFPLWTNFLGDHQIPVRLLCCSLRQKNRWKKKENRLGLHSPPPLHFAKIKRHSNPPCHLKVARA